MRHALKPRLKVISGPLCERASLRLVLCVWTAAAMVCRPDSAGSSCHSLKYRQADETSALAAQQEAEGALEAMTAEAEQLAGQLQATILKLKTAEEGRRVDR